MEYKLFTDKFGNFNDYTDAEKVGPSGSVLAQDVDVTQGSLKTRRNDVIYPISYSQVTWSDKTIVGWSNGAVGMPERYAVAQYNGRIYRSHKGISQTFTLGCVQYTTTQEPASLTSAPTWDCLGLAKPLDTITATAQNVGGSSLPAGTYSYVITYINALGQESGPSLQASVVVASPNNHVALTNLPIRYATITPISGTKNATVSAGVANLRVGMRIKSNSAGLATDTYIASISGSNITLSQNATTSSAIDIYDAQITGRKIYRNSTTTSTYQYVTQVLDMTSTSIADNGLIAAQAIQTFECTLPPANVRDVAISPNGVITFVQQDGNIAYMLAESVVTYRPDRAVRSPDVPLASVYGLDRFIYPSRRGAFSVSIEDVTGVPVVQMIDADEPCKSSPLVYCADVGNQIWWNTNKGIVATDGSTITPVTRFVFSDYRNEQLTLCYGMLFFNGDVYVYAPTLTVAGVQTNASIYVYNRQFGWSESVANLSIPLTGFGAIGFENGNGTVLYTKGITHTVGSVYSYGSKPTNSADARYFFGTYKTGEWIGENVTTLKKFRKFSVVYSGSFSIITYIDGSQVSLISELTPVSSRTKKTYWLPAGTKGRAISFEITLDDTTNIEELGVWIGEQREAMP